MIAGMKTLVKGLIVTGAAAQHVLEILLSDRKKADSVEPLIVALRQLAGESIRAPAEVLDVASDILKMVVEMRNSKRVGFGLCHR